jgi:hypothetical protein
MTTVIRYRALVSDSFDIRQTGKALDPQWICTPSEMKNMDLRTPTWKRQNAIPKASLWY